MIKACINNRCDEVAHNCPEKESKCRSCGYRLITISEATYRKKYVNYFFQYDYSTTEHELIRS